MNSALKIKNKTEQRFNIEFTECHKFIFKNSYRLFYGETDFTTKKRSN